MSDLDAGKLDALFEKVLPFVRAAEAVALRLVGKVRTLAWLGGLSALWLLYACQLTFGLTLAAMLPIAVVLSIAPLVLGWMATRLRATIGLPQRVTDTANRLAGKASEYRELYKDRSQLPLKGKPTLRQLWSSGRSLLEVKGLSDEAAEVFALAAGALMIANPVFAIALAIACVAAVLLMAAAFFVGVAHL